MKTIWGSWATSAKWFPSDAFPPEGAFFARDVSVSEKDFKEVARLRSPGGPLVSVPIVEDDGYYRESSLLSCRDGKIRFLVRSFSFDGGKTSMDEAVDGSYLVVKTIGGGRSSHLSGSVFAVCLSKKPARVFVYWLSVPMSKWEIPVKPAQ